LAEEILFAIAACCTKLSVLTLIYRITSVASVWTKNITIVVAVVVTLDTIAFTLVTIFQCTQVSSGMLGTIKPDDRPISDLWAISLTPQRCIDFGVHMLVASVFNTVQDFVIVLVPVKTVIGLHLPVIQRVTVLLLFAGGILVGIAGAVRTHFSWLTVFSPDGDINWHTYDMMLASSIELLLGIVCASVPATKPFFSLYGSRLLRLTQTTRELSTVRHEVGRIHSTASSASIYIIWDFEIKPAFPKGLQREMAMESGPATLPDLDKPLPKLPKQTPGLTSDRSIT
ncbi:hypothetical protein MMYC01_209722, partial [Madurella mycetomatis]